MGQTRQDFEFKTQKSPKMKSNTHWENIPFANIPPTLDTAQVSSFINISASNVNTLIGMHENLTNTITNLTSELQTAACSLGSLLDGLKGAQNLATQFATENNKSNIFFRPIGVEVATKGTITNYSDFIQQVEIAVNDTAPQVNGQIPAGKIPKVISNEFPLNPQIIAEVLTSKVLSKEFANIQHTIIPIQVGLNPKGEKLSNEEQLAKGFTNSDGTTISLREKIKQILIQSGVFGAKTIQIQALIKILVDNQIINSTTEEILQKDKSIVIQRLSQFLGKSDVRVGGILLVGQASDVQILYDKIKLLSKIITCLQPLVNQLQNFILASQYSTINKSGISPDDRKLEVQQLNPFNNVGTQDLNNVKEKALQSGALNYQLPSLTRLSETTPQPPEDDFNAWRHFSLVDLVPGLNILNGKEEQYKSAIGNGVSNTLGEMIEYAQQQGAEGLNQLDSLSNSIASISDRVNQISNEITKNINALRDRATMSSTELKGHIIGSDLNLTSNTQFIDEVKLVLNDSTDPNIPYFGQSPILTTNDILGQSNKLSKIWFGLLIFIVGESKDDLAAQISTTGSVFSMDISSVKSTKTTLNLGSLKGLFP